MAITAGSLQHPADRIALGILQGHRGGRLRQLAAKRRFELEMVDVDRSVAREDRGSLQRVLELPHVAGPGVGAQPDERGRRQRRLPPGVTPRETLRQRFDVAGTLAKRRDPDREHVQPVVEIFAEAAGCDLLAEVAVGRGDDAHVHPQFGLGADRLHAPVLEHAKEARLQVGAHLADLVEQQRPAIRGLEMPLAVAQGAGEGAAAVSEQLRFEEVARQGRAVDRDERAGFARALAVDQPGEDLFPGSGFGLDQHRDVRARGTERQIERGQADRILGDQLRLVGGGIARRPAAQRLVDGAAERLRGKRLHDVVDRTVPHARHGGFHRAERGHDDHTGGRRVYANAPHQLVAVDAGHPQVGDDDAVGTSRQRGERLGAPRGGVDFEVLAAKHALHRRHHLGLVVHHEDPLRHGSPRRGRARLEREVPLGRWSRGRDG